MCTVFPEYQAANDTAKNDKVERPVNVLFRRDDHSNDLIVHFFNEVSRLLDCDSAQDFKAEGYRCQKRDSVMEHFHLNQGLSPSGFPQIEATRAAFAVGHKNSSITRPAELVSSVVQGVRYAAPLIGISLLQFNLGGSVSLCRIMLLALGLESELSLKFLHDSCFLSNISSEATPTFTR